MSSACHPATDVPPWLSDAAELPTDVGPGREGENPSSGAGRIPLRGAEGDRHLGGALESLFDSRAGDDVVAVAKTESGFQRALLVPETVEVRAEALELGRNIGVVALGQDVPQLRPPLARLLDLLM